LPTRGFRRAVHGFKAHVGADADTALVEEVAITPANVNDGKAGHDTLPDDPGEVFADSAYRGPCFAEAVRARGGTPRIVATGMWGSDEAETLARLDAWKQPIHRIRGRVEKIFGTWKRSYGLRRMRWRGLANAAAQVHLTAIAYNLKRSLNLLAAQSSWRKGRAVSQVDPPHGHHNRKALLHQPSTPTRAQVSSEGRVVRSRRRTSTHPAGASRRELDRHHTPHPHRRLGTNARTMSMLHRSDVSSAAFVTQ
jgi:IS5 family transposase